MSVIWLGERTFGVLTKLDLMDKGTNALDVISSSLSYLMHVPLMFKFEVCLLN